MKRLPNPPSHTPCARRQAKNAVIGGVQLGFSSHIWCDPCAERWFVAVNEEAKMNKMTYMPPDDPMVSYETLWLWEDLGVADQRR